MFMKNKITLNILTGLLLTTSVSCLANPLYSSTKEQVAMDNTIKLQKLDLTTKWDKTFKQSEKVVHSKVTFANRYGITLAADLYLPKVDSKEATPKFPAIVVMGPYGAVKEQVSGMYAQTMAEKGYLTLAVDPSFFGESGGEPRYLASPEISTEDFSAAIDYLLTRTDVAHDKIGILGICGFGGFAINAAASDPRIKATVTSTMYDMSRVNAFGYNDVNDEAIRAKLRQSYADQRTKDYKQGYYDLNGGVVDPLPKDAPLFVQDYYAYYKTKLGYHPRSPNSNHGLTITTSIAFMNMPLNTYAGEIKSAVLMVHGSKAHSRYFSEDTFKRLKGSNKELLIIEGANHTDLYYKTDVIPFAQIAAFYQKYL